MILEQSQDELVLTISITINSPMSDEKI